MDIIKTATVGIGAVLLALMFKNQRPEFATLINLACCLFIFFCVIYKMQEVLSYIEELSGYIKIEQTYIVSILKMIGITYISEFASDICRDVGYSSVAGQIQIFAKMSIILLSMPVLLTFLSTVGEFL
ncbi:MAG: SpoIIIAC/SpoIIIAD family protein [Lachnospiraceae bacterium]|nr:stage III sporulation protein AD [Lachnospiraceae bacterium]MDD6192800.1 SpoIIIAC/SpoIIIAD family protein [Lachnospiraceae bacterium]MDY4793563.1 SpoIIIAC/SpoIIIAD family protein [Pararoseburia sp.]